MPRVGLRDVHSDAVPADPIAAAAFEADLHGEGVAAVVAHGDDGADAACSVHHGATELQGATFGLLAPGLFQHCVPLPLHEGLDVVDVHEEASEPHERRHHGQLPERVRERQLHGNFLRRDLRLQVLDGEKPVLDVVEPDDVKRRPEQVQYEQDNGQKVPLEDERMMPQASGKTAICTCPATPDGHYEAPERHKQDAYPTDQWLVHRNQTKGHPSLPSLARRPREA
mmetsp:Transcript_65154/g.130955  ORF Transcript_65154/g.130955 Transcript_65154/m.130955 type:complete len:226 (+) Transcript_65154:829-1506(+)